MSIPFFKPRPAERKFRTTGVLLTLVLVCALVTGTDLLPRRGGDNAWSYAQWYVARGQWHADMRTAVAGAWYLLDSRELGGQVYASNSPAPGRITGWGVLTNSNGEGPTV